MEKLCGSKVSMVFQDPMLTLNPTIPVGKQITEAIIKNQKVSRDEAKKRAVEMLKLVGIPDAEQRYGLQPHFFSGGMRQRCVLAIALACDCLLYTSALHHMDAFPIDTHIRQVMDVHYKRGFPNRRYRGMRGIMQQYIFYYDLYS